MLSYASKTLGSSKLPRGRRNIFFYSVPPRTASTPALSASSRAVSSSPINFQQAVTMRRRRNFSRDLSSRRRRSLPSREEIQSSNLTSSTVSRRGCIFFLISKEIHSILYFYHFISLLKRRLFLIRCIPEREGSGREIVFWYISVI